MRGLPGVLLLLAVLAATTIGCVAARNVVADRDLVCRDTPDDVCIRVADLALTRLDPAIAEEERKRGRIPMIQVYPIPCTAEELGFPVSDLTRCWTVEATNERGGVGVQVVENSKGTLRLP
jgi:hypothetical protein